MKTQEQTSDSKMLSREQIDMDMHTRYLEALRTSVPASLSQKSLEYNKTAIGGFILSIISIFGLGLAGLVGLILGIVALVQIKQTKERGRGLAIAAIAIGFIWSFVVGIGKRLGY